MRACCIILFFLTIAGNIVAQSFRVDSAIDKVDSLSRMSKFDSLLKSKTDLIDSIELKRKAVFNKINSFPSSLNQKITDSLKGKFNNAGGKVTQAAGKVDGIKNSATSKIDSINSGISNATDIDQLKNDKLDKPDNLDKVTNLQISKPEVIDNSQQKLNTATGSVNEKLNQLSNEAGGKGNLPTSIQTPGVPDTNLNLQNKLPGTSDLGISTPTITKPDINKPDLQTPNLKNPADNVKLPGNKTIDMSKVNELEKKTSQLSNVTEKASTYTKEISDVKNGGLEKANTLKQDAMDKAPVKGELAELQKQDAAMKEPLQEMDQYRNPEEYKKKTLERAKKMVAMQLATQSSQIQQATTKLSTHQKKIGAILEKKSDLPKKRDDWRRLKNRERLVPGLTLQVQKPGGWLVDVNPSMRYRLTIYWSIGAGWNHRMHIGNIPKALGLTTVFGPRAFSEVVLFKGFSFRADSEMLNARVPSLSSDSFKDVRVWNHQAGIKKDFSFMPKVMGNVQFMYNYYSSGYARTYPTRFNVRFGFEMPMKKKVKKTN